MIKCLRIQKNRLLTGQTRRTFAAGWKSLDWKHGGEINTFYPIVLVKRPTIRIRKVRSRDVPNLIRLLRNSFAKSEPLVDALRMPAGRYSPAIEEIWRNSIDYGMSFIAVPNKIGNNNIFGAVINSKICPWDPELIVKLSSCILCPKTKDLLNLWAYFLMDSGIFSKFNDMSIFNIANVIINEEKSITYHPELTGHNLANLLVDKSLRFAYTKGYKVACLVCTSDFLSKVAANIGMELFWTHPYKQLLNEKLEPLLKIRKPNTEVKIYVQELGEEATTKIDQNDQIK